MAEAMPGPQPAGTIVITTADGEAREAKTWEDGSWSCPFCAGANVPGTSLYDERPWPCPCANPMCIAGGKGSPEDVAAIRLERKHREEESSRREWLHRMQLKAAREREITQDKAIAAFRAEAAEHGYCERCWARSTDLGLFLGREKKVRHRKPENCPIIRRGTRL
jgi:hypothetical protein